MQFISAYHILIDQTVRTNHHPFHSLVVLSNLCPQVVRRIFIISVRRQAEAKQADYKTLSDRNMLIQVTI